MLLFIVFAMSVAFRAASDAAAAGEPAPKKIKLDNDVNVEGGIAAITKAKVTEVRCLTLV